VRSKKNNDNIKSNINTCSEINDTKVAQYSSIVIALGVARAF